MPLFECETCHAVDNTAVTNFAYDHLYLKKPALCSACDPKIGKWHGRFEKITAEEYRRRFPNDKIEYPVKKEAKCRPTR
jgi:hypothetical protein